MNNTNSNVIQDIVKKLPITIFFSQLPDRQQSLKYINWLYTNVSQSQNVDQDKLFREVISKELRIVSMKIIEIEILFMVALKSITLQDFTLDSKSLINKIIAENPDKNDLDLMYRILAQIMTKLPVDLRDKVTGKHKLQIFQSVSRFINMEPKLLERFVEFNPSLNTPISMDLDAGDYNSLNKKYLDELKKFQESQPYVDSNSMEYASIASKMLETTPTTQGGIKSQYIDSSPDLMVGSADNKLYYFDSSSGTISEFPISNKNQIPVSMNDLTNILTENKVNKGQINNLISSLQPTTTNSNSTNTTVPFSTHPISFLNSIKSDLGFNSSNPLTTISNIPTNSTANTQSSALPPIPPQFILSQSGSANANASSSNYNPNPNPNSNYNPNYNPNDFINPTAPIPGNFNILPQQTSNFLTRNDKCSIPNPPASCPVKTNQAVGINSNLNARFAERDSTYSQIPTTTKQISHFSNMNSNSNSNNNDNEAEFIKKLGKNNKDIENVAIAFVTVIILLFLLVIFNSIRNKSALVRTK